MVPFFTVMHLGVGYFSPPCLSVNICACSPWHSPTLCKSPDPVRQCFAAAMTRLRCQTEQRRGQKVKIFGSDSHAPKRLHRVKMHRRRLSSKKSLLLPSSEFWSLSSSSYCSRPLRGWIYMKNSQKTHRHPCGTWDDFQADRRRPVLFCASFWVQKLVSGFSCERHYLRSRHSSVYRVCRVQISLQFSGGLIKVPDKLEPKPDRTHLK